jgi:hypothetical protein
MDEHQTQDLGSQETGEQGEQQLDPIVLLGQELQQIREALGIGENPSGSSLLNRLNSIEQTLSKTERERNLPASVTRSQLQDAAFLRRHGIDLSDISLGKIQIVEG